MSGIVYNEWFLLLRQNTIPFKTRVFGNNLEGWDGERGGKIPQQSWTQGATGQKRPLGKAEAEAGSPRTVGAGEVSEEGYSGRGSG